MDWRKNAKKLLRHYFTLLAEKQGIRLDSDCLAEIDDIVDSIIQAAVDETRGLIRNFSR